MHMKILILWLFLDYSFTMFICSPSLLPLRARLQAPGVDPNQFLSDWVTELCPLLSCPSMGATLFSSEILVLQDLDLCVSIWVQIHCEWYTVCRFGLVLPVFSFLMVAPMHIFHFFCLFFFFFLPYWPFPYPFSPVNSPNNLTAFSVLSSALPDLFLSSSFTIKSSVEHLLFLCGLL